MSSEEFEDTKGAISIRISKKNRQRKGQKKKVKLTNNDLLYIHKTKDRVTPVPLKTGSVHRCSGRISSSCSTSGTSRVNLVTNLVISHERGKNQEVFTTSRIYPWSFVRFLAESNHKLRKVVFVAL
jgi:hypothetical protein